MSITVVYPTDEQFEEFLDKQFGGKFIEKDAKNMEALLALEAKQQEERSFEDALESDLPDDSDDDIDVMASDEEDEYSEELPDLLNAEEALADAAAGGAGFGSARTLELPAASPAMEEALGIHASTTPPPLSSPESVAELEREMFGLSPEQIGEVHVKYSELFPHSRPSRRALEDKYDDPSGSTETMKKEERQLEPMAAEAVSRTDDFQSVEEAEGYKADLYKKIEDLKQKIADPSMV